MPWSGKCRWISPRRCSSACRSTLVTKLLSGLRFTSNPAASIDSTSERAAEENSSALVWKRSMSCAGISLRMSMRLFFHPFLSEFHILFLHRRPRDLVCDHFTILALGVFLPGVVERREVNLLRVVRQVIFHRIGQVGDFAVRHASLHQQPLARQPYRDQVTHDAIT